MIFDDACKISKSARRRAKARKPKVSLRKRGVHGDP